MTNPKEVTSSNSHAVLISELTDLRRHLWEVISAGKKVVQALPPKERMILLDVLIEAEKHLL